MKKDSFYLKPIGTFMVGGISHSELMAQAVATGNIKWTPWVEEILNKVPPLPKRFEVEVVKNNLRIDLPKLSDKKTLRPMYEEAIQNGYCLCPVTLGFEILLQKKRRGFLNAAILAMKPVELYDSEIKHTQKELISVMDKKGVWSKNRTIHITPAGMDDFADGGFTYLLCRQNRHLKKAGFATIDF